MNVLYNNNNNKRNFFLFQTVWHIQLVIKLIKNADRIYMQQEGPISIVWMAIGYIDSIVDIERSTGDSSADRRGPSPFALHPTTVETQRGTLENRIFK
jgi:hypothetical protein